jgi:fucose permease
VLSGYFIFSAFVDDADPAAPGWLNVYYLLAALAGAAMLLLARTRLDESAARAETATQETVGFAAMVILFRKPLIYTFIVCAFLYVLIEQSIMTWLPTFNSSVLNMSASLSIQMTSILAAATAAGRFSAGFLLRRVDWYLLLSACLLLAGTLVLVVLPLAESAGVTRVGRWADAPLAAFVFPLIGALLAPVYPAINSVVLSSLAPHQHAPMAGLIVLFSALGGTTGSILTGTLFELLGGRNAFYFSLLPIAAILITLWFFKQQTRRDDNAE